MATQMAETPIRNDQGVEAKQSRFFQLSLDMCLIVGFDGYLKQLNPMCEKTLLFTTEELLFQPLLNLIHPEDRRLTLVQLQKLSTSTETLSFENRCRCQDGSYKWLLWNATPCHEEQLIYAVVRDITERKRSQEALQQAHEDLERWVEERTAELQAANVLLKQEINERKRTEIALRQSKAHLKEQAKQLEQALYEVQRTQAQLIQTEKMSSLGQLVAGVAHEINNPVSFIYCNIDHASRYIRDLLHLLNLYQTHYPQPPTAIQNLAEGIDIDFLIVDMPKLLSSIKLGAERIRQIVASLRNFSRHDEAEMKFVDIHEGIDNTLKLMQNRLKGDGSGIQVIQAYGELPRVECYPGLLNQVFMNLLNNAIDALETHPDPRIITICTSVGTSNWRLKTGEFPHPNPHILIRISDNGPGITEEIGSRLFDPFFTTKPVGKGVGLGLSTSYHIVVEKHEGRIACVSEPGKGAEFIIEIPVTQRSHNCVLLQPPSVSLTNQQLAFG